MRPQGWYFGNQIFNAIIAGKDFFREELPWSLVVYYVVFVACSIVFIPYGPFCIAIGFIFGVYWGFLIQMGAIFVSSAMLFIIGRYLFKDYVSAPAESCPLDNVATLQLTLVHRHARHMRMHARAARACACV